MKTVDIARACHEANRAYCITLGDMSQVPWDEAPPDIQQSAIAGVKFVAANPDAGDSALHFNWTVSKVAGGWKYGEVKDAVAKTHPCLVPFDKLPEEQQRKDKLFRAVVKALL